jgi:hypothetical protein
MNIEAELTRRIGDAGAKLHTARSRNDQVALDLRPICGTKPPPCVKGLRPSEGSGRIGDGTPARSRLIHAPPEGATGLHCPPPACL